MTLNKLLIGLAALLLVGMMCVFTVNQAERAITVSYTHLTLPTTILV